MLSGLGGLGGIGEKLIKLTFSAQHSIILLLKYINVMIKYDDYDDVLQQNFIEKLLNCIIIFHQLVRSYYYCIV